MFFTLVRKKVLHDFMHWFKMQLSITRSGKMNTQDEFATVFMQGNADKEEVFVIDYQQAGFAPVVPNGKGAFYLESRK